MNDEPRRVGPSTAPGAASTTGADHAPTSGAEAGVGVLRLPWLHWPYLLVLILPLVILLAGAAVAFPGLVARLQLRDYRASERQVHELAWPARMQEDPTLTACGGFATRCARTDAGPGDALKATSEALAGVDVHLGPVRCGAAADTSLWLRTAQASDCTAVAHASGYSVLALATEYASGPSDPAALPLGYTQVSVVLVAENPRLAELSQPPATSRAPLPLDAADIPGLPSLLRSLPCTQPEGDGCRGFGGTIALPGSSAAELEAAATRLVADLRGGGYRVEVENCRDTSTGRRCTVSGMAFRSAGANDFTSVTAIFSPDKAGGLAVLASVSAP